MANKKGRKASDLKGLNIYQDPKKGTIWYDYLTKKGFQLTSAEVGKYSLSQAFLPVSIILIYFLYKFVNLDIYKSVIISIIAYVVMRMLYRVLFLNKLPVIENYDRPDKGNLIINAAKNYSSIRIKLLIILSVILIGVTIAYIVIYKPIGIEKVGMILLALAAIVMLIFSIVVLSNKKKINK